MVRKDHQSEYEDIVPLPVSTREPGEAAGLLPNGATSDKRVAFDVEFDIEDDVLLNWQHSRPSGWLLRRLPRSWQQVPECWLRLSKQQRNLAISGAVALAVLTLCVTILGAAWVGKDKQHFTAQYMSAQDSPYCSWTDLYLPTGVRPAKYTLHVKSTLQPPYTVNGEVDIQLQAAEATPCVVLHANGLQVQSVELLVYEGDSNMHKQHPAGIKGSVRSSNKTSQQVILQFPHALPRAPLVPVLRLKFGYPLQEGLDGFYRSSYIDAANETRVMASTQFESIAARKAFPCFDEPSFKAVFEVKVSAPPPSIVVLSNMPLSHTHAHKGSSSSSGRRLQHEDGEEDTHKHSDSSSSKKVLTEDDLIAYHFLPTPPMSTYLVAWVVGELSHNELQCPLALAPTPAPSSSSSGRRRRLQHEGEEHEEHEHKEGGVQGGKHNVTVRVWGTNDRVAQFGHARDVACAALQEMEKLTQVSFPLPKLDLVAIPNFAAGAMENWGLLTYRERALLVDDSKDDMHQRYAIATTVAHETAHQWFGNLATLDDWTELWINEGLASYMEAVLADAYQPGMGYLTNFFTEMVSAGLEADGSLASHPLSINRPIRKLSEVDNWFDSVSYNKGAAVLRMLRAWVSRADSTATGLQAVSDAPSAVSGEYDAKFASTSQQWVPHLRRRLQQQQQQQQQKAGEGSRRRKGGVTSSGSDDSSTSSSNIGVGEQQQARAPWTAHKYSRGPSIQASISPVLHTESGELSGLEVLPAGPAAPPAPKPAAAPAKRQPSAATAVSVGSRAGWLAAAQQQLSESPAARELDGGAGSAASGDAFVAGLGRYVKAHAYGNSGYKGLWSSIGEAAGEPVEEMMSVWTLRRGFPIVTVSLGPQDTGSSRREVKLEQVPYHAPRTYMVGLPFEPEMYCNDWSDDPADSSWWIPVPLRLPGVNNFQWHAFNSCSSAVQVDMPRNTQPWVLANTGRFGFYRVNYSEPLWNALAAVSTSPQAAISSVDFAGLLDDAYSLSHVRQLNISIFLNLIQALGSRARPELPPWDTALGWLQRMTDVLSTAALLDSNGEGQGWKDCMAHLKKYVRHKVTKPFIDNVRVPGQEEPGLTFKVSSSDPPELRLLRPLVLEAAGFLGYTQAVNTAVDLVAQQASGDADAVAPDVAKAVYALAAASGSEAAYATLVNMYEQATDAADKDRALRALARVTTKPLISKTLEYALSPAVRTQDVAVLLVRLAKQGGLGFNMTWQFVIDRADDILEKYGGGDVTYSLGLKLNELAKLFVDEALLERLKALDKAKPGQIFSPTFFEEANEARMLNHDFLRFQGQDACRWLEHAARRV